MTPSNYVTKVDPRDDGLVLITCSLTNTIGLDGWMPGFVMPKVGEEVVLFYQDKAKNFVSEVVVGGRIHDQTAPRASRPPKNPHAVLGSELALIEACYALHQSAHPRASLAFIHHGKQGRDLAKEVEKHVAQIQAALANWREALDHYEETPK